MSYLQTFNDLFLTDIEQDDDEILEEEILHLDSEEIQHIDE